MTIARARILVCQSATVGVRRTRDLEPWFAAVVREFPTVHVATELDPVRTGGPVPTIDLASWTDRRNDFAPFDAHVEDLARRGPATLVLRGDARTCARSLMEMLTRWQRLVGRRNAGSSTPEFEALLGRLRALHAGDRPLVRADWNHALDTWQWMVRLCPHASREAQMAALLHDVERRESEAERRIEHLAPSYAGFKDAHARRGAQIARALLEACGVDARGAERVADLVAAHERPGPDEERALLNDADALSFFSQNSAGYVDYFGAEQARRKIAYTLARARPAARARLAGVRLRADVERLLAEVRAGSAPGEGPEKVTA